MASQLHDEYLKRAEEKLNAANYLFEGKFYFDSISRAYYSMYYSARALLSLKEIYPKSHRGVITQFGLEFVKQGFIDETLGKAMNYACDRRQEADYGVDLVISKEEAEDILDLANEFFEKVNEVIEKIKNKL